MTATPETVPHTDADSTCRPVPDWITDTETRESIALGLYELPDYFTGDRNA